MKIGIDARLWSETGVGRYTQELIRNLSVIDKENEYLVFADNNFPKDLLNTKYLIRRKALLILNTNIRWHSLKEQVLMPFLLWKEHLDLVHFPYFSVPILYPGKFIVTIHDLILDHFDTGKASTWPFIIYKFKRLGYKLVMWIALHRAFKVITVSETTKREVVEHYKINPEKVAVTYESA